MELGRFLEKHPVELLECPSREVENTTKEYIGSWRLIGSRFRCSAQFARTQGRLSAESHRRQM